MDVAGEQQNGLVQDVTKTRLAADGTPVGVGVRSQRASHDKTTDRCNCFGAETEEIKARPPRVCVCA